MIICKFYKCSNCNRKHCCIECDMKEECSEVCKSSPDESCTEMEYRTKKGVV